MNVFTKNPNLNKKKTFFLGGGGTGLELVKIYFFSFRVGGGVGGGGTRVSNVFYKESKSKQKELFFLLGVGGGLEYVIYFLQRIQI